jgi:uncharacterized phage-associated protein
MPFIFCHQKATQALNFFAHKSGDRANKLKVLKLVFFADRHHFRTHGRPVIGDSYYALKFGPVASGVKDIVEHSPLGLSREERHYAEASIRPEDDKVYWFRALAATDTSVFSKSDLESLEWAWQNFGGVHLFKLAELTHLYPEWKRHETALQQFSLKEMSYADFLDDPDEDPFFDRMDAMRKADILEAMGEREQINRLLCP